MKPIALMAMIFAMSSAALGSECPKLSAERFTAYSGCMYVSGNASAVSLDTVEIAQDGMVINGQELDYFHLIINGEGNEMVADGKPSLARSPNPVEDFIQEVTESASCKGGVLVVSTETKVNDKTEAAGNTSYSLTAEGGLRVEYAGIKMNEPVKAVFLCKKQAE